MPITGRGWELLVERLGTQTRGRRTRTYGRYSLLVGGASQGITGFMCEAVGPGDNSHEDNGRRIEAGAYPLWTRYGTYVSNGVSKDRATPGASPMPGVMLGSTGKRTWILIHPAHPPREKLFLSSIGCMNPTGPVTAADDMDFWDSRARVIAIIDSLRNFAPTAFQTRVDTAIPHASVVMEGEPDRAWPDSAGGGAAT